MPFTYFFIMDKGRSCHTSSSQLERLATCTLAHRASDDAIGQQRAQQKHIIDRHVKSIPPERAPSTFQQSNSPHGP